MVNVVPLGKVKVFVFWYVVGRLVSRKFRRPRPWLLRYEAETTVFFRTSYSTIASASLIMGLRTPLSQKATFGVSARPVELVRMFGYTVLVVVGEMVKLGCAEKLPVLVSADATVELMVRA